MDELIKGKRIELSIKYRILVNYLKDLIEEEEGYTKILNKEDIRKILRALGEVE